MTDIVTPPPDFVLPLLVTSLALPLDHKNPYIPCNLAFHRYSERPNLTE